MDQPDNAWDLVRAVSPLALPDPLIETVDLAYRDPPRVYHSIDHVAEVAGRFGEVARGPGWRAPREVFLAVLFHDAIYVVGRGDNEAQSAALARKSIADSLAHSGIDANRVAALIEWTARHGTLSPADVDAEAALFLDCDMAILGAARERFERYDEAIRAEYAAVPPDLFNAGRRAFFERLLARDRIYLSDWFHRHLEGAARANLEWALASGVRIPPQSH